MAKPVKPSSSPFDALLKVRHERAPEQPNGQTSDRLDVQPSKHLDVQPSKRETKQLIPLAKSTDPDFIKFTTYIRKQTHRAVKVRLVERGKEFSDLVENLLNNWLQNGSPPF
jgi:hypothetical protein